ncbi:hypothetical protein J0H58_03375 [bacterium]|nr:hypothetical protein [bacterium]
MEKEAELAPAGGERWMGQEEWPEALAAVGRADTILVGGASEAIQERVRQTRKDAEVALRLEGIPLVHYEAEKALDG